MTTEMRKIFADGLLLDEVFLKTSTARSWSLSMEGIGRQLEVQLDARMAISSSPTKSSSFSQKNGHKYKSMQRGDNIEFCECLSIDLIHDDVMRMLRRSTMTWKGSSFCEPFHPCKNPPTNLRFCFPPFFSISYYPSRGNGSGLGFKSSSQNTQSSWRDKLLSNSSRKNKYHDSNVT